MTAKPELESQLGEQRDKGKAVRRAWGARASVISLATISLQSVRQISSLIDPGRNTALLLAIAAR